MEVLVRVFLWWLLPCILSTIIGVKKGRGVFGFVLGFLFAWLGFIVICCFKKRKDN